MRIAHRLHGIAQTGGASFVTSLHQQTLHRDPSPEEMRRCLDQLAAGVSKPVIIAEVMTSPDAERTYQDVPLARMDRATRTIANRMQQIAHGPELAYVYAAYMELLNRIPNTQEVDAKLAELRQGLPRLRMAETLLRSPEAQALMTAASPPGSSFERRAARRRRRRGGRGSPRRIGIFLMHTEAVRLDGEGISRYTASLVDALLTLYPRVSIHVATNLDNEASVHGLFAHARQRFGGRLTIHATNSVERINREVPADAWIVPYVGLLPALGLERPIVLCLHDLVHWHFPDLYYREDPIRCHILDRFVHELAHRAEAVTFLSDYVRQHEGLRFLGLEAGRAHVLRHAAPDVGTDFTSEQDFRRRYGLHGEYVTFPTVLRLHKNGEGLIEGFVRFKQTAEGQASGLLLALTDTPERMLQNESIRALIGQSPDALREDIRFLGRLPGSDLPSLYRYAAGTIVPTLFEGGFPLPILESLTVGTPVAAAKIGVVQEIVPNADVLFGFDPHDANDIARAIAQLRQQGRSRVAAQQQAAKSVLSRSWLDAARECIEIIRRL